MKKTLTLLGLAALSTGAFAQVNWVYDNTSAPSGVSTATSDTDLGTIWGDQVALTQGGVLDGFQFGLYNSSSSAGSLLTATVQFKFYDLTAGPYTSGSLAGLFPLIGGFNGNINFGTGLNAGFFTTATFTGLSSLGINLPTNIMITQQVTATTGTANRLGVVTYTTDNIGSSLGANAWYKNNTAGGEGLFAFAAPTSNKIAYKVGLVPEPASFAVVGLGLVGLVSRRRRRSSK